MTAVETRHISRDSLFLLATVQLENDDTAYRIKVRNLSDGGMMGEGVARVQTGMRVTVDLRNIGPVDGSVAWVQGDRFGVAFDREIEARRARAPVGSASDNGQRSAGLGPARKL